MTYKRKGEPHGAVMRGSSFFLEIFSRNDLISKVKRVLIIDTEYPLWIYDIHIHAKRGEMICN
ncbi:hypothetical protein DOZ91_19420 [Peribacillus frigoritolerans]|nr:hypothetical protein DOZ91_19420 [Peribacillus frigoritolerans]